jgi:FkbM family methyltransferase
LSNYNEIEEEVILDIGANIGTHTMELAKIFPKRKIMAFEPNPLLFPLLQLNTLIFKNIFTYSFAIAESTGKLIYLDLFDPKIKNTNTGTAGTNDKLGVNPCVTLKLDDILFSRVKLIKLDIQGGELLALQGLSATINTFKPIIFLEVEEFYLRKNGVSSEILLRYLFSFNYEVYRFETAYPTDHIAVPKDFDVSRIRTRYELKRIPSDFRNLIFENKWFYSSFR